MASSLQVWSDWPVLGKAKRQHTAELSPAAPPGEILITVSPGVLSTQNATVLRQLHTAPTQKPPYRQTTAGKRSSVTSHWTLKDFIKKHTRRQLLYVKN